MAVNVSHLLMSALPQLRWDTTPRRVRADVGDTTVVDSTAVRLVFEPHRVVPAYAVPIADVHGSLTGATPVEVQGPKPRGIPVLTPADAFSIHSTAGTAYDIEAAGTVLRGAAFAPDDPDLAGYVVLDWAAFDRWREEEQEVVSHPHDPHSRIDCLTSARHVVVRIDGTTLADSARPVLLLETGLPPRWYLPRDDVRMDLLTRSDTRTTCAYKGEASYWSAQVGDRLVRDIVWTYEDPLHDAEPVRDLLCFYDEHVDLEVDGVGNRRPTTEWSS